MQESCWMCLGIDPTADIAIIKKAYAKQLKVNKPDKNPEGFLILRAAYEQALSESWWYEEVDYKDVDEDENEEESNGVADDVENGETSVVPETVLHITLNDHSAANIEERLETELLKAIQAQNDKQEAQHDEASESSASNFYAEAAAIEQESAELLSYFKQAATDEEGLESLESSDLEEQNLAASELEEDDLDEETFTPYFFESSQWSHEWQQICEDNEADATSQDQRLHALLLTQLETSRSLDEQNDFEEALLVWFDDKPTEFTLSYQWAKSYFGWDERLEDWSRNEYPWYRLDSLDERYQQVSYFKTPYDFYSYLAQHFPLVASHLSVVSLSELKNEYVNPSSLERMTVFKQLFFPFRVTGLSQELKALDADLEYYINDHPAAHLAHDTDDDEYNARYWQQNSALTTLKGWILERFIQPRDFIIIAVVIATIVGMSSLITPNSWTNFYFDGVGVFVAISISYLFWQLQLRLFATPDHFISKEPWATGWRNASILFFILGYISWLDVATLDTQNMPSSPVYFLTQLAGASLFAAYSMRQDNIVVKVVTWHAAFLLLIITVLVPLLVFLVEQPPYDGDKTFAISPLVWLLLTAPAFLVNISHTHERLEWLANIGFKLLNIWSYLMYIGLIIIYAYCVDILYERHFGFTAIIVIIISIVVAVSKSKFLNNFEKN